MMSGAALNRALCGGDPCTQPLCQSPRSCCREYQQYLHDAVATILFGEAGQRSSTAPSPGGGLDGSSAADGEAAVPGSWQSLPTSPRGGQPSGRRVSSLVPALQQQQQAAQEAAAAGGGSAADVTPTDADSASAGAPAAAAATAPAAAAAQAAPAAAVGQSPAPSTRTVTQEELAAEQSGDWQVCSAVGMRELLLGLWYGLDECELAFRSWLGPWLSRPWAVLDCPTTTLQCCTACTQWQLRRLRNLHSSDAQPNVPPTLQVLFCEQQLDCQLALEDPSPGMPWGRARFQARLPLTGSTGGVVCSSCVRMLLLIYLPSSLPAPGLLSCQFCCSICSYLLCRCFCTQVTAYYAPQFAKLSFNRISRYHVTLCSAGHRILRAPVCGAAAPLRGGRRGCLPGLAVALPQVGITRRQVGRLLCAVLRQAVGVARAGCLAFACSDGRLDCRDEEQKPVHLVQSRNGQQMLIAGEGVHS